MTTQEYIPPRTSAEISILRRTQRAPQVIHIAPITKECKRTFQLMEKDTITLSFRTAEPINFAIGDFIRDELFGTFYLLDEVMPSYEKSTGTYKYELEFHAPYYRWRNKLFMLTSDLSGVRVRKETSWQLTAQLKTHVEEVINNLNVLGLKLDYESYSTKIEYNYSILPSAEHAGDVKYISYAGVNIIDALNQMADEYECEWWVDEGTHTIYFGKCEGTNDPIELELHKNVETMSIKKNESDYANKIFVYGSKDNIPESYRKKLVFDFTDYKSAWNDGVEYIYFWDKNRRVTSGMLAGGKEYVLENSFEIEIGKGEQTIQTTHRIAYLPFNQTSYSTGVTIDGKINVTLFKPLDIESYDATIKADIVHGKGDSSVASICNEKLESKTEENLVFPIDISEKLTFSDSAAYYIRIEVTCKGTLTEEAKNAESKANENYPQELVAQGIFRRLNPAKVAVWFINEGVTCVEADGVKWCKIYWEREGQTKEAWVTNEYVNDSNLGVYGYVFRFVSDRGYTESYQTPQDFDVQEIEHFTLQISDGGSDGLIITKVPFSFFADEYENPSTLTMIGERRLQLPIETNGYLVKDGVEETDAVEAAVVFEDIKPHLALVVSSVTERERSDTEEFSDGSQYSWQWVQYTIKLQRINSEAFTFSRDYIPSGQKLQIYFFSDMEAQEAYEKENEQYVEGSYLIAGMTFDVDFNQATQEFTLIRNEEYGAKLPNETLKPKEGDVCILLGWDVRAIESLGLVAAAEQELKEKGEEYLDAIEENQFTFECDMMSDSVIDTDIDLPASNLLTLRGWSDCFISPVVAEPSTSDNLLTGIDEDATGWENAEWLISSTRNNLFFLEDGPAYSPVVRVNPQKVYCVSLYATADVSIDPYNLLQVYLDGKNNGFETDRLDYKVNATHRRIGNRTVTIYTLSLKYRFTGAKTAQLAIFPQENVAIYDPSIIEENFSYHGLYMYTGRTDSAYYLSPENIDNLDPTKEYIVSFWSKEEVVQDGEDRNVWLYKSDSEDIDIEFDICDSDDVLGSRYYAIVSGVTGVMLGFQGLIINAPKVEENFDSLPRPLNFEEKPYFLNYREGTRVIVNNDALSAPKDTRVLGYELKLDYPYDTPKYTVGETDTYSRLKQIEKEITKLK